MKSSNPQKIRLFPGIRNAIVAGIIIVIPIGLTLWFGQFVYNYLSGWAIDLVGKYSPSLLERGTWAEMSIRIASIIFILLMLFFIGVLGRYTLGKKLISLADAIMRKVPMLSIVYTTARQIWDAIWSTKSGMFNKVVMFEYPRKGIWVIGFLTNENEDNEWEIQKKTGEDLVSVFLPTTPNPTSGFLLFLPRKDCQYLNMDVAEGMRLVISGGAVVSNNNHNEEKTVSPSR